MAEDALAHTSARPASRRAAPLKDTRQYSEDENKIFLTNCYVHSILQYAHGEKNAKLETIRYECNQQLQSMLDYSQEVTFNHMHTSLT